MENRYTILSLLNATWIKCTLAIAAIVCATNFILKKSLLVPSASGGSDAAVFSTIGFSWLHGLLPYKDLADHKGPVLYLINMFGWAIADSELGIILIECLFISFICLITIYTCRRRYLFSLIALYLLYLTLLNRAFEGGNLTEEYAAFFSIVALSATFITKNRIIQNVLCGICGALCFYIRPNMASIPLALFVFSLWDTRGTRHFLRCAALTGAGFLSIAVPINIYFYAHNALADFYALFVYANFSYIRKEGSLESLYTLLATFKYFMLLLALFLSGIYFTARPYFFRAVVLVAFSAACSLMSLRGYYHYMLGLVPAYIYMVMCLAVHGDMGRANAYLARTRAVALANEYRVGKSLLAGILCLALGLLAYKTLTIYSNAFAKTAAYRQRAELSRVGMNNQSSLLNLGTHEASSAFYYAGTLPREKAFFPSTFLPQDYAEEFQKKIQLHEYLKTYDYVLALPDVQNSALLKLFVPVGTFKGHIIYKNTKANTQ